MAKEKRGLWSGLYGLIWRLGAILAIYVIVSNISLTGTFTFNADKGINLLFKNIGWIVKSVNNLYK